MAHRSGMRERTRESRRPSTSRSIPRRQNRGIVDIELAPRNKDGLVEFTSDVLILKPRDPLKSNGTAIIDVPNRGRMLSVSTFNRGASVLDPQKISELEMGC